MEGIFKKMTINLDKNSNFEEMKNKILLYQPKRCPGAGKTCRMMSPAFWTLVMKDPPNFH